MELYKWRVQEEEFSDNLINEEVLLSHLFFLLLYFRFDMSRLIFTLPYPYESFFVYFKDHGVVKSDV